MHLVNLTPHRLNIVTDDHDEEIVVEPSGIVCRVETHYEPDGELEGIPLTRVRYGAPESLPDPQDDVAYVVSGQVEALVGRDDVFAPGELIRDDAGRVVGCKGLKRTQTWRSS